MTMTTTSRPRMPIAATLAIATLLGLSAQAHAQKGDDWPSGKPIRLVVGFPAGGASDVAARSVAAGLAQRLNASVIVDNRPGAASNIGSEAVAKAAPDGYTLLFGTISMSVNPALYKSLSFDPRKDFVAITQVSSAPFLLVVHPSTPYKSVKDLVAAARRAPGSIDYATAGNGSGSHLFMEYFANTAGVAFKHIPYRGAAPAMNDVLGGQVPVTFDNIITTLPLIAAGKLVPLGVSTAKRSAAAPDIPTLAESGVQGFDATSWFGLFAPTGTPRAIVERLHRETAALLKQPEIREKFLAVGNEPVGSSPAEFTKFYADELSKWARVVKAANVQLD